MMIIPPVRDDTTEEEDDDDFGLDENLSSRARLRTSSHSQRVRRGSRSGRSRKDRSSKGSKEKRLKQKSDKKGGSRRGRGKSSRRRSKTSRDNVRPKDSKHYDEYIDAETPLEVKGLLSPRYDGQVLSVPTHNDVQRMLDTTARRDSPLLNRRTNSKSLDGTPKSRIPHSISMDRHLNLHLLDGDPSKNEMYHPDGGGGRGGGMRPSPAERLRAQWHSRGDDVSSPSSLSLASTAMGLPYDSTLGDGASRSSTPGAKDSAYGALPDSPVMDLKGRHSAGEVLWTTNRRDAGGGNVVGEENEEDEYDTLGDLLRMKRKMSGRALSHSNGSVRPPGGGSARGNALTHGEYTSLSSLLSKKNASSSSPPSSSVAMEKHSGVAYASDGGEERGGGGIDRGKTQYGALPTAARSTKPVKDEVQYSALPPKLTMPTGGEQVQYGALSFSTPEVAGASMDQYHSGDRMETFLESIGLLKLLPVFEREEIDFEALALLRDEDMRELGLPLGNRCVLKAALSGRLERPSSSPSDTTTPYDVKKIESAQRDDASSPKKNIHVRPMLSGSGVYSSLVPAEEEGGATKQW